MSINSKMVDTFPEPAWIVSPAGELLVRNHAAAAFESSSSLGILTRLSNPEFQLLSAVAEVSASGNAIRMQPVKGILTQGYISVYPTPNSNLLLLFLPCDETTKATHFPKYSSLCKQIPFNDIFQSFFDLSPIGLLIEEREGKILTANPAASRIFQVPVEELIGATTTKLIAADRWSDIVEEFHSRVALNEYEYKISDVLCQRYNGESFTSELKLTRLWVDAKPYTLIHIEDRTETIQIVHQAQELEATYLQLFQNSPVAYILWDPDGEIREMNPVAKNLFFSSDTAVTHKSMRDLLHSHSDPNDFLPNLSAILSGEWFHDLMWHYTHNDRTYELESSFFPHYAANGAIIGGVMITRDTTAMNRSLRDWRQRNQQLAQLLDSISRLSSLNELQELFDAAVIELSRLGLFQFVVGILFKNGHQNRVVSITHSTADSVEIAQLKTELLNLSVSDATEHELNKALQGEHAFGNCYLFHALEITESFPLLTLVSRFPSHYRQLSLPLEYNDLMLVPIKDRSHAIIGVIILSQPLRQMDRLSKEQAHIFELFSSILGSQIAMLRLIRQTLAAEQRYHTLIDRLGEGVIVTNLDNVMLLVNPAAVELLGYSSEELVGEPSLMIFPEDQHKLILRTREERRRKHTTTFETVIQRKDGNFRTVLLTATPLVNEREEFSGSLGLFTDITERRANELALRQAYEELAANNRFANLVASHASAENIEQKALQSVVKRKAIKPGETLVPVSEMQYASLLAAPISGESLEAEALQLILDTVSAEHGAILLIDPEQNRMNAVSVKSIRKDPIDNHSIETMSQAFRDLLSDHPEGFYCPEIVKSKTISKVLKSQLSSFGLQSFSVHPFNARNTTIGILFVGDSETDAFSQSQRLLLNSFSEQLSLALDNVRLLQALLNASSNWAITFDAMPDPIFVLSSNGKFRRVNKATSKLCGIPIRELIGRNIGELFDEFGRHLLDLPANVTELEETHTIYDQKRTYSITIVPIPPSDRLVTMRDITESRFLQEQIFEAQRRELVIRFAGGIAHDFNNLLVGIMGAADLLGKRIESDSPHQPLLKVILETSKRAAELVRQLLAYARGGTTQVACVDMNGVVTEVQKLLRVTLQPDIDIVLKLKDNLPHIITDDTQFQQIVMNLGINAGEVLGGRGTITFETGVGANDSGIEERLYEKTAVWLRVYDTGPGFPRQILDHAGEPFNSTKGTGRGLGLAAVFGIVARHNGKIVLNNRPEGGACVTIAFASAEEGATPSPQVLPPPVEVVTELPPPVSSRRVLIVDDEDMVRMLTREVLESAGFVVSEASDGVEGIEKLQKEKFDLTLLDIVMPRMGGIEVYHALRKFNTKLPVLFVSGYDESDMVTKLSDKKLSFLQKPFIIDEMIDKVNTILKA